MRNLTVDIAKGIAGVLVIAGHSIAFRYTEGWLLQCSHLGTPLFIFLSGVFINIDGNANRVAAYAYGPKHVLLIVYQY